MAVFTNYIRIAVIVSVVLFVSSAAQGAVVDEHPSSQTVTPLANGIAVCGNNLPAWIMSMQAVPEPSVIAFLSMSLIGLPLRLRMRSR